MNYGTLYGVGVGPGAPDLITLRALDVLRRAPVLALPRSNDHGASMAWQILRPTLGAVADQLRLFLTFPMSKDPARLRPAWDAALAAIGAHLEAGRDVAFATEGDPSLFSSFIYLAQAAPSRWPGVKVEVVPGITSITAVPSVTGVPLADGQERIAIIPATYGLGDLEALLAAFDTVVLMKLGGELPHIIATLTRVGLLDRAVYVSRATMADQRILRDLREVPAARGDCFAMIIVSRKEHSGVLAGTPLRSICA
ncbi:MAG: precorrin-2 C(20)-methyltransferase [Deltaproteobacteria bacterium]|nr:precorrin-2 C(20)-methyltransferase [Deltaproteobacteria bacterium]